MRIMPPMSPMSSSTGNRRPMKADRAAGILDVSSLREQVYAYLRAEISRGHILPGTYINLKEISRQLGISTTPLRDAIIQLECEGFVTILPRRGVLVKRLTLEEIRDYLQIIGALEASVFLTVFPRLQAMHIDKMDRLNGQMITALKKEDFDSYYHLNIDFHDIILELSTNQTLHQVITPMKQRLYDFPPRTYITEWELINCNEHSQFIELIRRDEPQAAAGLWKDRHWSFEHHEKYIRRFYSDATKYLQKRVSPR